MLVASQLSPEERELVQCAVRLLGRTAAFAETFELGVTTHVIATVPPPESLAAGGSAAAGAPPPRVCRRTLKYMQGILAGCWVVTPEWLRACIKAG